MTLASCSFNISLTFMVLSGQVFAAVVVKTGMCASAGASSSLYGGESRCVLFFISDIAINSHPTALMLLWRPTPMGYVIKVGPSLYSCIL